MILYFTKIYIQNSLKIAALLLLVAFWGEIPNGVLKSFIYAGIFSGLTTNYFFQKNNLWVLYYNLRIPRYLMILINIILFEIIAITLISLSKSLIN